MTPQKSSQFEVEDTEGHIYGYTKSYKTRDSTDLDLLLWQGGTQWHKVVFKRKFDARQAIKRTNDYRKKKGWEPIDFIIVLKDGN